MKSFHFVVDFVVNYKYTTDMMKQDDIIQVLETTANHLFIDIKMTQPRISRIINNKESITFPLAIVLSKLFPGKTIPEWKEASGEDFSRAFNSLKAHGNEVA